MSKKLIISSDSHVVEPPDLWQGRMSADYGDRVPHLVEGDPYDQWYCDHQGVGVLGGISQAGKRYSNPEDITLEGSFADVPPGGYNPHAHVQDLDVDGVYADVLYPSIGLNLYALPDPALLRDVFSAYNDWLAEFCNTYPKRLKGIAMILLDDDMDAGISELKRSAALGLCGAMIPVYPRSHETYDKPLYEPFWAAAHDLNIPLSLHTGTNLARFDCHADGGRGYPNGSGPEQHRLLGPHVHGPHHLFGGSRALPKAQNSQRRA